MLQLPATCWLLSSKAVIPHSTLYTELYQAMQGREIFFGKLFLDCLQDLHSACQTPDKILSRGQSINDIRLAGQSKKRIRQLSKADLFTVHDNMRCI